ncbi:MAG: transglutaminase domain-containing protein [Candidatus Bathyarchaeia archaeon]
MSRTRERGYPKVVNVYRERYHKMAKPEYLKNLKQFARTVLKDPLEDLDWKSSLNWEHRHLEYTRGELPKQRAEMPMDIIKQSKGRCGEFALLYNGLLLANAFTCRLIIDCSALNDKSTAAAGDHVWNEVQLDRIWVHVDPTERRINQPWMYAKEWNKDVNLVFAVGKRGILEVTENYRK